MLLVLFEIPFLCGNKSNPAKHSVIWFLARTKKKQQGHIHESESISYVHDFIMRTQETSQRIAQSGSNLSEKRS
jgi:hypothetical protein